MSKALFKKITLFALVTVLITYYTIAGRVIVMYNKTFVDCGYRQIQTEGICYINNKHLLKSCETSNSTLAGLFSIHKTNK
ncbi:MAG: hypothetical protein EKK39_01180 [Sphingobacteriales bacterium]|uniref:hypothetical protein n=1 Tax=Hydrotalea flava TaxID=714549 RepID=UPI00082B4BE6|nr:hypothetical protein [Hydrotalea flava]RTL56711.1 MAG: hypothetical protein EKK39_01180 [Sphingobacteriales bacterium]